MKTPNCPICGLIMRPVKTGIKDGWRCSDPECKGKR